jgi:enoyl-CoA hydratase/carnithine racemase
MSKSSFETIIVAPAGNMVTVVTLNRPEVMNALNTQMGRELNEAFTALASTRDCGCVILTGAGDRAFCAGGDLKERRGMTDGQWRKQHEIFERAFAAIRDCPLPVVAAIKGVAYAGGLEIAMCCDFMYAAKNARFALTEVSLGIMPGGGGTQNLPRAVGERRAKELILAASPFSADEAAAWGLVNRLFEPAELMTGAMAIAERIARNAPLSVRQAKKSIHRGMQTDLEQGMLFEVEAYNLLVPTADRREGINSFNEKRPPRFTGT